MQWSRYTGSGERWPKINPPIKETGRAEKKKEETVIQHMGINIVNRDGKFWVGEKSFVSKWNAKLFIEGKKK